MPAHFGGLEYVEDEVPPRDRTKEGLEDQVDHLYADDARSTHAEPPRERAR